ncbi:MAG: hypothetical protein AABY22_32070 [Nanoarchaeota archaeon]
MRKGQRKCTHRFKGIYNQYNPRFKIRIRNGKRYLCTDYQCQIKGCQYWKIDKIGHLLPKKKYAKANKNEGDTK